MVIRKLQELFGNQTAQARQKTQDKEQTRVQLATCVLLLAIAHSDDSFTEAEEEHIVDLLKQEFQLSDEYVSELLELARQQHKESVDLFRFTSAINGMYSPREKERVVELLWKTIYIDDRLHSLEDSLIHRLSRMLNLSHHQLIAAKKRVKGWK